MAWNFVGRTEQVSRLLGVCGHADPAVVIVAGAPGIGLSSLLDQVAGRVTRATGAAPIRLRARGGDVAFGLLGPLLPGGFGAGVRRSTAVSAAARLIVDRTSGGGGVIVVDDAHLADHSSLLVLRELHRDGRFRLLLGSRDHLATPDPLDCLRFGPGVSELPLPPLSAGEVGLALTGILDGKVDPVTSDALHAASGGNPTALRALARRENFELVDGKWRVRASGDAAPPLSDATRNRVVAAVRAAWRALDLGLVDQLCGLLPVRPPESTLILATAQLLRSGPTECLRLLESLPSDDDVAALVRAMALALGLRRFHEADQVLAAANAVTGIRAWLAAVTGRAVPESLLPADAPLDDPMAILFDRMARGLIEMAGPRPGQAVAHLRRAVIAAQALHDELPWVAPYAQALLIDALLVGGRIGEATSAAARFHAARRGSGWPVAVAVSVLAAGPLQPPSTGNPRAVAVAR